MPSRQEGFSIAITEALACGLPVVITDQCHFPEVAEVEAGAVVPVEPEPVADALVKILGDDALRDSMSAAGRNLIETRFTWPRIAERMIEAYEGLL